MSQSKKEQRADLRRVLANVDPRWIAAASRKTAQHLGDLFREHFSPKHLLLWTAHFPGEVDLTPVISESIRSMKVYLPRISPDGMMEFFEIGEDWGRRLEIGAYGIPEVRDPAANPFPDDVAGESAICVPGLGFDLRGGRLGRGRGYYDRFLSRQSRKAITKIGVGWELQVVQRVCYDVDDVSMDWLVTEDRIVNVNGGGGS